MKVFNFLLLILLTLAIYSPSIHASEDEEATYTGRRGLAQERIQHFEKIIQEHKEKTRIKPSLKVVKRTKPFISKFPIEDGSLSTVVDQNGEVTNDNFADNTLRDDDNNEDSDYSSNYVDPVSSDIEGQTDNETTDDESNVIEMEDIQQSKILEDEVSTDIDPGVQDEQTQGFGGDAQLSIDTTNPENQSENVSESTLNLTKSQKKKLEKERLKLEKKERKLNKQKEKERLRLDKLEKKREKEERKRLEAEKKKQLKNEKKNKNKNKGSVKTSIESPKEKKSSCFSKKSKQNNASVEYHETLEEKLSNQEVVPEDTNDEISTIASENEVFDNISSVDEGEQTEAEAETEAEDDIKIEKSKEFEFDEEEEDSEIKARMLAGNESDFKTERISSEEVLQDSDSDYLENDEYQEDPNEKYRFSQESEDLIAKERAVKPLEGIEIEGISEGEDDETSGISDIPVASNYSLDHEEEKYEENKKEDSDIQELSSGIELSNDNDIMSNNEIEVLNSGDNDDENEIMVEEEEEEEERKVDDDSTTKDSKIDERRSDNKVKSFFGKIKSFFKKKPFALNFNCKGPSCIKRLSKKDEPKYSSDFIPRIYLLSRSIPKENFYRVPEIMSSLRTESNRLVLAFKLIDESLIPSSALALNSKSFIVRRWSRNVQTKLRKLRSEFDSLKGRLSSMYHEGVIKGEYELFVEEMDDLTIMLYLLAKEFPSKSRFAKIAKDILRYPEVVSSPGERLVSMFRKSKAPKCFKKTGEPTPERSDSDKAHIKILRRRMRFIKKRLSSLGK
ncbi:hypothetical protein CmeUKMEL1_08815 [Cryptosporidium meleagridis]|uniref:Integral membrane protein n=1 Tax=Cryptosporidium meleagridis TaxID=93969 RepID=A0A2P4Z0X9_9CRYT|nr:hypothetical protein CmeUKMEL1_08815 [Cryptosporidium meleagridis]